MGTRFLIDSSAGSKFIMGLLSENNMDLMSSLSVSNLSIISKIELLSWKAEESIQEAVKSFIKVSNVIDMNEKIIDETINIRRKVKIKLPDAVIAATAIVHNLTLLSTNDSDFLKVPKLKYKSLNT